jgi:hypothetical protein
VFGVRWKGRRFLPPFHRYLDFSGKYTLKLGATRWELTSKLRLQCLILPVAVISDTRLKYSVI